MPTNEPVTPEPVHDVPSVAAALNCHPDLIYRLIKQGQIQSVRVGRHIRITQSALDAFLSGKEA